MRPSLKFLFRGSHPDTFGREQRSPFWCCHLRHFCSRNIRTTRMRRGSARWFKSKKCFNRGESCVFEVILSQNRQTLCLLLGEEDKVGEVAQLEHRTSSTPTGRFGRGEGARVKTRGLIIDKSTSVTHQGAALPDRKRSKFYNLHPALSEFTPLRVLICDRGKRGIYHKCYLVWAGRCQFFMTFKLSRPCMN